MAEKVAIVGPPGTGKSYSLRNLNPEETIVVAIANKVLPFKGAKTGYKPGKNWFYPGMKDKNGRQLTALEVVRIAYNLAEKHKDKIKQIIIDDARYLMSFKYMKVKDEIGYGKFSAVADEGYFPVEWASTLQGHPDLTVVFLYHSTEERDDEMQKYRIRTSGGKLVDNHIVLDGLFTIELFTHVTRDPETEQTKYEFLTNDGIDTSAKSPPGMFEGKYIPNDLKDVLDKMHAFLN